MTKWDGLATADRYIASQLTDRRYSSSLGYKGHQTWYPAVTAHHSDADTNCI
jgi:hypothetical protein